MKHIKKIATMLLCGILLISVFAGCSSGQDGGIDIIYPISGQITSYDPQVASTADEYLIIENCYEGLVRTDDLGNITPGAATDWSVSDDGLIYTFNLRKGAKWHINDSVKKLMGNDWNPDITANDFVFAFKRAVDPAMQCPLASTLSGISGAPLIISGTASADILGVTANNDYSLTVKLSGKDALSLSVLSTAAAMPCNEEFFNAADGRYGLGSEYSIFNGPFYFSTQLESSYVLKKNTDYNGESKTQVSDITLNVTDKKSDIVKNIQSGYYDAAYLTSSQYAKLDKSNELNTVPYADTTWSFLINCNSGALAEKKLRQAICMSVSRPDYSQIDYYSAATGVTPPSCKTSGNTITDSENTIVPEFDTKKAVDLWKQGLEKTGSTSMSLTIITTDEMTGTAKELIQGIQSGIAKVSSYSSENIAFSFSLKIETMTKQEIDNKIALGDYDIALYPMKASSQSPVSFLSDIANNNKTGFSSKAFAKRLDAASKATSENQLEACRECERALMSTYSVMPVIYESGYYASAKGVSGINFHPGSGRVSFINAKREK